MTTTSSVEQMTPSIESWRMPSGRVATIDLSQTPEQIEMARRLLRDNDAEPVSHDEQPPVDGMDIHPEIPMPHWMNNRSGCSGRYLDDDGRIVKDEADYDDGQFAVTLNRMHSLEGGQVYTSDDNADVCWISKWEDESGADPERFTILARDIPELIGVLQRLHERFTPPDTKQLKRAAEVEEALREREF